jgi:alpha-beta hydrolase superfamily lysophospholipase
MKIARLLKMIAPHWRLKAPVKKELLSHLNSEQAAYEVDRLMHRQISLRLGAGLIDSGLWALEHAAEVPLPCLVLHGSEDRITDPAASAQFAQRATAAGAPVQLRTYLGMLHDLHRDQGREKVIEDIAQWVVNGPGETLLSPTS